MQFVKLGPDVPERLLQAHEDGQVVFFCGAGVSLQAGLPDFEGLVNQLYSRLGEPPSLVEQNALNRKQYNTALGLLEARVVGKRETVRRLVEQILTPPAVSHEATATHEALLTLARCRTGRTRLVTTNFDRLFEVVIERGQPSVKGYYAPLLPSPKSRWDGIVYLHGRLPVNPSVDDLDQLVLSSGDFGLAYLTERWAARFVGELFRKYTVCFVGYSIDDAVLRYMMDALSADRLLGESSPEVFAFGGHPTDKRAESEREWLAKSVTPVLYDDANGHSSLHRTLQAWAATYRDGVGGKEQIVAQCAALHPLQSTKEDDFIGRLVWALSDETGLPARRFAENVPVPPLDWLEHLAERRFTHDDLQRFGVARREKRDDEIRFSLLARPAPYELSPWMTLAAAPEWFRPLDDRMHHLARWMLRYLDDPRLVLWLTKQGGRLHDRLAWMIEGRLDEICKWERETHSEEFERERARSPNGIPRPGMRILWRLVLTNRVRASTNYLDLYQWMERLQRDGLTATLRMAFREILTPCVEIREPFRMDPAMAGDPDHLRSLADIEVVLATDHVHGALRTAREKPEWKSALPRLLDDAGGLLADALNLLAEVEKANMESDYSYVYQPSIAEHSQNRDHRDWTALIDVARDAWLATAKLQPERARVAAQRWWMGGYPLLRRLALFAATERDVIPVEQSIAWLLEEEGWWLWSVETQREALSLLRSVASRLDPTNRERIEGAIVGGPPARMYPGDSGDVTREIWLRLAKLKQGSDRLGAEAQRRLDDMSGKNAAWTLQADESEEFPYWTSGGWGRPRASAPVPRRRRELVKWLKEHPAEDRWTQDGWTEACRVHLPAALCALFFLAKEGTWPDGRWGQALRVWADEKLVNRSWRWTARILARAPEQTLSALAPSLSWWLEKAAKLLTRHEEAFFFLCGQVLAEGEMPGEVAGESVFEAINHPVGEVTQALLNWWYRHEPNDDDKLPGQLKPIFTRMCDTASGHHRHARVLLAANAIALFRVDPEWAHQHLLPLFDWSRSKDEARRAWQGFLWSPRLHRSLVLAVKRSLLDTARHYAELSEHGSQYATLLLYAALESYAVPAGGEFLSAAELQGAFRELPPDGLAEAAQALNQALEGAGDQREALWDNRVAPFWCEVWPRRAELASPAIANELCQLCVAAGSRLPDAFRMVKPWLQPTKHPDYLLRRLNDSGQIRRFPNESLALMDAVVGESAWLSSQLAACLDQIKATAPSLVVDQRYQRLDELRRRRGLV